MVSIRVSRWAIWRGEWCDASSEELLEEEEELELLLEERRRRLGRVVVGWRCEDLGRREAREAEEDVASFFERRWRGIVLAS
jgi:hypothetical protein